MTIYLDMTVPEIEAKVDDNVKTKVIITTNDNLSGIAKVEATAPNETPVEATKQSGDSYAFTGEAGNFTL